ncbi:MAG: hypothetical protein A3G34_11815 [Candidatus Lindowbacteria bacterium RIFCSPLOWO2_12_FULL_62_27]|nr:MAG: hypothetical protein A3G34_11815 [Candidatus Lindowbacteria bacterium RIFCSPLOWO2_12_FULL_62_27]OGH56523.1 MAG: hypothetical protein A3I06_08580 [Candidatus Lindowbacteria bacterium RIFCSPLOWO2_02_FULL_62_12]
MDEVILEREAMRLPPHERALLADALLGSLDDDATREIQAAWANEAEDRMEAFLRGEIKALDGPEVLREFRARYQR